jgi:SAM-dependent MidA family methyltransferase
LHTAVEQELRDLIAKQGRITFARFMQICLYSPRGGFYAARQERISAHFGTSAMSHPVFGALIARQLEQMWQALGEPGVFHLIEVGAGDGALARSIEQACRRSAPRLAEALRYVAVDYAPRWLHGSDHAAGWDGPIAARNHAAKADIASDIQRVRSDGLRAFRHAVGCILSNELIDNLPVHRFVIQDGRLREIFVALSGGQLAEVVDEPSTPRIERRLADLGLSLPEGYRGEVNLDIEDWTLQTAQALDRGFVLTIDYGELASVLYGPGNRGGTLVCYHRHAASSDPLRNVGRQDITCQVDFTSLMRLGERHGLVTLGYGPQSQFLANLGFSSFVAALESQGLSSARATLNRIAMMALVDPEEYGNLKVLAQAKGLDPSGPLLGFAERKPDRPREPC